MKRLLLVVALTLVALPAGGQPVASYTTSEVVLPQIALREGVTVDLSFTVYSTQRHPCPGRTFLAIHGMLHTAAAYEPLAAALFAGPPLLVEPCRVLAMDLPGHGGSSLPSGALFGDLTLDDYVTAVLGSLDRLHHLGIYPDTLVGHSLGGALVVLAQQRLKAGETNLRRAHGVQDVVLLGSAVLNPVMQPQWDSGAALAPILAYGQETPELGRHVAVPVGFWRMFMFSNPDNVFPGNAPSVAEIVARGYFGPKGSPFAFESRAMLDAMVPRPSVDAGLFGWDVGTKLTMVAYEQDRVVRVDKLLEFYTHLTEDPAGVRFVAVGGAGAIHDTHVADPWLLLEGVGSLQRVF